MSNKDCSVQKIIITSTMLTLNRTQFEDLADKDRNSNTMMTISKHNSEFEN